jgi:hypothetical protein
LDEIALEQLIRKKYEYRTLDGSKNNLKHPQWGQPHQQLLRLTTPAYEDGKSQPSGANRPHPREISNHIFSGVEEKPNSYGVSAFFWLWGQFIDHDLSLTPPGDEAWNIPVPAGDPYFDPAGRGDVVIPFHRSLFDPQTGIDDPRQQINEITSYMDASGVYGSEEGRNAYLRKYVDGDLLLSQGGLPPLTDGKIPNEGNTQTSFFVCGDLRANEHAALLAIHAIFVREHNYWCRRLQKTAKKMGVSMTDEDLYQKAKIIVEAEIQSITYREFLLLLIGKALSPYRGYQEDVSTQVATEFSAAAFRLGHSLVSPVFSRLDEDGQTIWAGNLSLRDSFFAMFKLSNEGGMDPILRGLAKDSSMELDAKIISALRNFLFGEPGQGGLDLAALNIQRGRDHGLAGYNHIRKDLGLPPKETFEDFARLASDPALRQQVEILYGHPDALDLWVGGLLETRPHPHPTRKDLEPVAMLGETFLTIVKDQFERLRDGDRFWYQHRLTTLQGKWIERSTLSDVIHRNSKVKDLPRHCMKLT